MTNWYDLPTYYDVSFSYDMSDELSFLKKVFKKYCNSSKPKLLEPACGTGRLIIPLTFEGFDCSGFDLNKNAISESNTFAIYCSAWAIRNKMAHHAPRQSTANLLFVQQGKFSHGNTMFENNTFG